MLVTGVAVLALGALVGAFLLGRVLAPPPQSVIEQASANVPVYAAAEERVVDARAAFIGQVAPAASEPVVVQAPGRTVVTEQPLEPGATIERGGYLGAVAGSPYFALPGPLALYRDIAPGDAGNDVRLLQASLLASGYAVTVDGTARASLFRAVQSMRTKAGFTGALERITAQELVAIGALPAEVASAANVGTEVTTESPLVAIRTLAQRVEFRADPVSVGELALGTPMRLTIDGAMALGTITEIGEFQSASDGQSPGRTVTVASDDPALASAASGLSVTVAHADPPPAALAVPLLAVRTDSEGTFVLRKSEAGDERVAIEVGVPGSGWARVTSGELSVGDLVLIS